jgi:hypothetical protein
MGIPGTPSPAWHYHKYQGESQLLRNYSKPHGSICQSTTFSLSIAYREEADSIKKHPYVFENTANRWRLIFGLSSSDKKRLTPSFFFTLTRNRQIHYKSEHNIVLPMNLKKIVLFIHSSYLPFITVTWLAA